MVAALFISLALLLLLGVPVGFSIGMSTLIAVFMEPTLPAVVVAQKIVDGLNSFTLMPLPLFILSGAIMVYGSTPRIMRLANLLLRKKPWGIGNVDVIGCCAFGTISGSGVATVAAIGSIVAPEMVKKGYSKGFTASLTGAAGVLGIVIPPSIAYVVYSQMANVSISDMFLAGFLPGVTAALCLCLLNKYMVKKKHWCTENTAEAEAYYAKMPKSEKVKIVLDAIPPMLMPIIILGGVLSGIVTATEAAAIAVIYAVILSGLIYKELGFKTLLNVMGVSAVSAATILIIIGSATPFAWILTYKNVTTAVAAFVTSISSSPAVIYGLIIIVLLILGCFMETIAIILMTVPMFLPIVTAIGVDPIAYGITLTLALCVGGVTPPLAVNLFTACKIINIRVEESIPEVYYVVAVMIVATVITAAFPEISLFLPHLFG